MEAVFLVCFLFGVVFTLASVALGHMGGLHHAGADGHHLGVSHGHAVQAAHGGQHLDGSHAGHPAAHGAVEAHAAHLDDSPIAGMGRLFVSLFNVSSLLAFLTWFGAVGYLLLKLAGWPLVSTLPVALLAGAAGGMIIARFLAMVRRGEQVMDPRDYRLEGTLARVTVTIPTDGVGEIVFEKAGARRSEAARGYQGRAIARGTEVAIVDYQRGTATVDPLRDAEAEERSGA